MPDYSTIVIGGGTMGSAAAWELGKRGERALVFEQFGHVHGFGAHSGKTRIIRHAYSEGADYVPLVLRADDLWVELEAASGQKVLHRVGGLEMSAPGNPHTEQMRYSAETHNVPYEVLEPAEVQRRWPQFAVSDDWDAIFCPRSGFLVVEPALKALGALARALGVEIRENEPVRAWGATDNGAWVKTDEVTYTADRLIITAGAWSTALLADLDLALTVKRKTLFWLEVERPERFSTERFPIFIADWPGTEFYGFPIFEEPGLKVAVHTGGQQTNPDNVDRTVHDEEKDDVLPAAQRLFDGVTGRVLSNMVCLYTMSADEDFIVDRHPRWPHVVFGAGFSGHGFKFATAIGEHLADLAFDSTVQPYSILSLGRLAENPPFAASPQTRT
jgi:monomeric sarcosine oxidase